MTGKFPIVGTATASLHLLINGAFFSLSYFFREKQQQSIPFSTWMFKNLSGQNLADYAAERIVELIYHPTWRITLMQLIEALFSCFENPAEEVTFLKDQQLKKDLSEITSFLYAHFAKSSSVLFQKQISASIDQLSQKGVYTR